MSDEDFAMTVPPTPEYSEPTSTSFAILDMLNLSSEKYFPERFSHHTSVKDPTIALANFSKEERKIVEANMYILQIFEQASRFNFELENDYTFYQDMTNESIYFKKNLSLGTEGKLLEILKSNMQFIEYRTRNQSKEEEKKPKWRLW